MKRLILWFVGLLMVVLVSCSKSDTDQTYPEISMEEQGAFPLNCDSLIIGQTFAFKAVFSDNQALGTFSIEIHNNFDHHTHSTDVVECVSDPDKIAVNPFLFIQEYSIPDGLTTYDAEVNISIPEGVDFGDYHFLIRLTDAEGWQTIKGISVKLIDQKGDQL